MCRSMRMQKPKKPKLPRITRNGETGYMCPACKGDGWFYKCEDRDVIEGYKLAPRYRCNLCKETGILTLKLYKRLKGKNHEVAMARYKKVLAEYKKKEAVAKEALKKLTRLEINYLKTFWGVR